MGVKDASDLPSNYVRTESEDDEDEEIVVEAHACTVGERDKRDCESTVNDSIRSSLLYSTTDVTMQTTLSVADIRECLAYEHRVNASRLGVSPPPTDPPPNRWNDYLIEQETINARRPIGQVNNPFHQRLTNFHQPSHDNVSMPADTLETIIRVIGNASRATSIPAPRSPTPVRFVSRRPAPPPVSNRGRGGSNGRGRGREPINRRGRRGGRTEDPRRNRNGQDAPIPVPAPTPDPVNFIPDPIVIPEGSNTYEEDAFLKEFANPEVHSSEEDVLMNTDIAAEGNYTI
jgi:hypothetical protein